jgi:ribosomal protein L7Ae-like RNA K-turn-binding protein
MIFCEENNTLIVTKMSDICRQFLYSDVEGVEYMEAAIADDVADEVTDDAPDDVADDIAPNLGDHMDFETALIEVVKSALKTVKHLDKRQAENCDQAAYKKLVHALCQEHQIPLLTVANNLQMDKYTGLCKLYAVCVVIRDCDKEDFLNEQIKPQQA